MQPGLLAPLVFLLGWAASETHARHPQARPLLVLKQTFAKIMEGIDHVAFDFDSDGERYRGSAQLLRPIDERTQEAKLGLVAEVAHRAWP